ncbi:MAG: hypothetical protein QOD92_4323 [Acidimicrobiaceae bacterium]|jgi:hypothetical protein
MFPVDNVWHADVSGLPIHPMSNTYVAAIGTTAQAKADFGSGAWDGGPIGIPYNVVGAGQPTTSVTFDYDEDSDHVPYPIPANASIEGGPGSSGDRHVIIVDHSTCTLYELYAAYPNDDGTWRAGSGAVWDLNSNALRPETWTSGDAAGLPILPGLVRYDEVASGHIDHAIRVTVPHSDRSYVWPARHQAGVSNPSLPPMGLRLRLKPDVEVSSYPRDDQVILQAMKTYGVIVADNGSPWFISGVPDERWNNDVLQQLRNIRGSDFEAVDESALMVDGDSGQAAGAAPGPPLPSAAQTGKPSQGSPAQASDTSPAAAAADPAPSTTSDPVTTTSAPSPNETAAHQPDVTVRARDRASRKGWPWIVAAIAAIVVLIGCGAAGARVRRRSGRETAESVVDHDSVAGPAGLEHSFAVARAPDRDGELVAGEHR